MLNNKLSCVLFLLFSLLLNSCYEVTSGCIDNNAVNFDFGADKSCDNCCEFPNYSIQIAQMWDSVNIKLGDTLTNNFDQDFVINRMHFFLSDFVLSNLGQINYRTIDTALLAINGMDTTLSNNTILVTLGQTNYSIGSYISSSIFKSFSFNTGFPYGVNFENSNFLPSDSNIYKYRDSLSNANTINYLELDLVTNITDSIVKKIVVDDASWLKTITIDSTFESNIGTKLDLKFKIDYFKWMGDLDLINDTEQVIEEKIKTEFFNSISKI